VKAYKIADLTDALDKGLKSGRDYDRGRKLFAAGKCFACHRFDNEGGSNAPDLTGVAGRFSPRDLLESVIDPSKEISDQYAAVEIRTTDERVITGRIVNLNADNVMVNTNMLEPGANTTVDRKLIESMKPSKVSMMPAGLIDTFKEDEVLDLMAYILSRGDRNAALFKK
jgi:putative heme-binding domain-containing protein